VAVRPAALVSDKKHIRGVYARCAIKIDTFTFLWVSYKKLYTTLNLFSFNLYPIARRCLDVFWQDLSLFYDYKSNI